VTVLFTDLVGSTELLSSLGEAAFDELRHVHFGALRDAINHHGGEEIKTLGDGMLAVFGSAADAVNCAVAMQQAVGRRVPGGAAPLALRVGLALGEVTFEENDVFGIPVVEAARLVAAARGGQILVTALVRAVGGGRSGASFTDLGPLSLKGLPEPVPTCEVAWEPQADPALPLPALLTDVGPIFVGRDGDLQRLAQLWKEAAAGERRIALLAGEPGVGKTRLAAELAGLAHAEGARVLAGRCDEDLGVPYQPFVEALRHFVDHTPAEELPGRVGRYGGELVRLVPGLAELLPGVPPPLRTDPETERYRLFDAVAGWLAALSAEQPVLLVIDDLQWAAKPTLLLFRHVARSAEPMQLLIIGTYRDTELGHDHPLVEVLADLRRQLGVERFSLQGLDEPGVVAYVERAAGRALGDEDLLLARAIHEETEGNPFFVREVLRHLVETGAVEQREEGWGTRLPVEDLGIPEGVREVVGRRLARLSDAAHPVLRMAAVAGAEFEVPVLQAAGELDEEDVLSALEEAAAARLVIETPGARYRFAHALVRHTLYDGLSAARRPALHRRVAEAIEAVHAGRLDDHLPALAYHYSRACAPTPDTAVAVAYAIRAGDRALDQLAHDEAAAYYHQALELLDLGGGMVETAPRLDLLLALGEAQRRAGDAASRQTLLDAAGLAAGLGDADRLTRAALTNHRGAWSYTLGVDSEKIAVLESALAAYPPDDSPVRARLLANLGTELVFAGQGSRHLDLTAAALAMARRLGDKPTLAHVLLARGNATFSDPPWLAEFLANSAELLALAEEEGDPYLKAYAEHHRFSAAFHAGLVEEADRALEATERAAEEAGQPILRWWATIDRAGRVLAAGRIAEAEALIAEVLELGLASGQPDARQFHATLRFELLYDSGRLAEDVDRLVQVAQNSERPVVRVMLALACSETGRHEEARAVLEPLVPTLAELPLTLGTWFRTVMPAALACARLGDAALALPLYDLILPFADLIAGVFVGWSGSASHHLGMLATVLGRFGDAEQHFSTAEATHTRMGAPVWLARTHLEWARMLLTQGAPEDADRARALLDRTLESARRLGLAKVESDTVALLGEF
jgi:class 3 adenylate cyclase/tetratricopeptide (TPR) repeat protein